MIHETKNPRTTFQISTAVWGLTNQVPLDGPPHFPRGRETQSNRRTKQLQIALNGRNGHLLHFAMRHSWNRTITGPESLNSLGFDYSTHQYSRPKVLGGTGTRSHFRSYLFSHLLYIFFPRAGRGLTLFATTQPRASCTDKAGQKCTHKKPSDQSSRSRRRQQIFPGPRHSRHSLDHPKTLQRGTLSAPTNQPHVQGHCMTPLDQGRG